MPFAPVDILRKHQEKCRQLLGIVPQRTEKEALELALKQSRQRESLSVPAGEFVRVGIFKYLPQTEALRWDRTRDVIMRVLPGADEDPIYLEMLARQAASVEVILRKECTGTPDPKVSALCDRVLLGTAVNLDPSAFSGPAGDHVMVVLSDGLISFLYQAAKAVVLSWRPVQAESGTSVSLCPTPADIEYTLNKNTYPLELLCKTIEAYLFKGYPRAVGYDPPSSEYLPALELLINHTERFVIAHEYGHALLQQLVPQNALPPGHAAWPKEYEADSFAFFVDVTSARELDPLPPNIALQGGFFSLTALEILLKALDLVLYGEVRHVGSDKYHPPIQQRISNLKQLYQQHVGTDLKYSLPAGGAAGYGATVDLAIEGALIPSNTLNILWNRVQNTFLEAWHQRRPLHRIWTASYSYG